MLDYRPDRTIVGHAGEIRFCVTLREVAQSAAYPGLDHETPVTFSGPAGLCLEGWENEYCQCSMCGIFRIPRLAKERHPL